MPGISVSHAAVAARMNAGTFETGTETSFFTLAPSRFCASECSSRSFQIAARCASLSAIAASSDDAVVQRLLQHRLQRRAQAGIRARRGELDQHIECAAGLRERQRRAGDVPQHERHAQAGHVFERLIAAAIVRLEPA